MSLSSNSRAFTLFAALAAACMLFAVVFADGARADDNYATDFEEFEPGSPEGQDGWSRDGNFDHEIEDISADTEAPVGFNDRTFRISNAITSGSFGDQTFSASLTDEAGETSAENGGQSGGDRQNNFEASFEFTSAAPGAQQVSTVNGNQVPLATVISPDRGDGARMSWVELTDQSGGLRVRFSDYQRGADENTPGAEPSLCDDQGCFVYTTVAENLSRNDVYTVDIVMDFVDGDSNDVVTATVSDENGEINSHTGTSWEDYYRDRENNPTRTVDSLLFRTSGTASPSTSGEGFFIDNLSLESSTVERPLIVDGDGLADVEENGNADCDAIVVAFSSIQGAVDAAEAGDTVFVCPGTYDENVSIQGKVGLALESTDGADVTTVDGTGATGTDTILADSNDVTIDGFTVTGAGRFGINQNIGVSNLDILNNVILDNPNIGAVTASNGGEVSGNLFDGNGSGLYFTTNASNITATDNDFDDNGAGIIFETGNTNNTVQSNNILNNDEGILFSEDGTGFANNDISQNRIFGNSVGLENTSSSAVNAENNWWGCNEGPNNDGCDGTSNTGSGSIDSDPHIVMDIRAAPMRVATGGSSEIIVRFLLDEGDGNVARQFPDGTPIDFSAMRGRVNPQQQETTNGSATTTLTTNSKRKAAIVRADLDAEQVRVRIMIRR